MSLHHVIIHCIASAVNPEDFMQSESTDPMHVCTQLLCSVGEQAVQELESGFIVQRYTWLQPFISLIGEFSFMVWRQPYPFCVYMLACAGRK